MRPIDADAITYWAGIVDRNGEWLTRKKTIDELQTLDVALAKHGEWILIEKLKDDEIAKCSVCCNYWTGTRFYKYCPNCGAKMDGRQIDDLS